MKDLPMFNKLFFALCSTLMIALTSPSAAEEPTYHTIQGSGGEYEVFGTKQEALNTKDKLTNETWVNNNRIDAYQNQRAKYNASDETTEWINGKYVSQHELWDYKIAAERAKIKAAEQKIIAPMGEEREKKYKAQKIADAKAKLIEDARLAKIAADKVLEDARLAKIAADRLAKIAADKVIEDARLAKIAADKEKEEKRLAKIAAAKKIEELQLASIAAAKLRREEENAAFAARRAEKLAENIKMAQDLAADKARRLREYEKNKAKNVASIALSLLDEFNKGPKDPNIIKSITKDGIVRTLYCNPGPCTPGSMILHGNISGVDMGVPVNGFAKQLKVHMADKKPGANFTVGDHLELIDPLRVFNDVEIINESAAKFYDSIDINLIRALSIPKGQVEKNKQAHTKLIESSHDNDVNPLQHGCWWC
jgi:hypothetical protein